ncbi:MAG TPA: hypothetical protein VE224_18945 [Pseudolabrys sp.]|jgi:uncharacterized membrane protein|nr:hypothetical protein [Pseudolabrys sp.]
MTQYWFRPKRYGYGATPVTWQGWLVTLAIPASMVVVSVALRLETGSYWALAALIAFDVAALAALALISYRKTEGGLRWRWGNRNA